MTRPFKDLIGVMKEAAVERTQTQKAFDTADPRIFISVEQMVDGQLVKVDREISLALWLDGRVNQLGRVLVAEVSAMMVEIGRGRP